MADSFSDKQMQANLEALNRRLQEISAQIEANIEAEQSLLARESTPTPGLAAGNRRLSVQEIQAETVSTDALAAAQERYNALLAQEAELHARASAAARSQQALPVLQERYQGALGTQAEAEAQQQQARTAYTAATRNQGSSAEERTGLLTTREQANQQAQLARQQTAQARTELEEAQKAAASLKEVQAQYAQLASALHEQVAAVQQARDAELAGTRAAEEATAAQQAEARAQAAAAPFRAAETEVQMATRLKPQLMLPPGRPGTYGITPSRPGTSGAPEAAGMAQLGGAAKTASSAENELGTSFSRASQQEAQAIVQMRQHGALTTEFVSNLAKGNVTLRQFGGELGTTIGKFAGWAGAATLTYGAFGALAELAKGASDAASGATQLQRTIDNLDPSKATAAIRGLSQDTNTSISEASDAIFRYSRTFHSLPEATGAASLGLKAFQLDGVAVQDSVKASTAITQQYGGGLGQLKDVYNELSAAQREYNVRISEMIPLLQKASGAVHNSGDTSITPLIQQGAYFQRVTQLSGSQIGTAYYRGASNFYQSAKSAPTFKEVGIDPTGKSITQVVQQALELVAKGRVGGNTPVTSNDLAKAIFGPQYGGRIEAGLSPQAVGTYLGDQGIHTRITAANTQGSLQKEFDTQQKQFDQRVHAFVNGLGRLGSSIADSGLFSGVTKSVQGLDVGEHAITSFTDAISSLPGPVKEAVLGLVALKAATAFFGRTQLGQSIGSLPGFKTATNLIGARPTANQLRDSATAGMAEQTTTAIESEMNRTLSGLATLDAKLDIMKQTIAEQAPALQGLNSASAEVIAASEEQRALIMQREAIEGEIGAATQQLNTQLAARASSVDLAASLRKGTANPEDAAAAAARYGTSDAGAEATARDASLSGYAGNRIRGGLSALRTPVSSAKSAFSAIGDASLAGATQKLAAERSALTAALRGDTAAQAAAAAATDGEVVAVDASVSAGAALGTSLVAMKTGLAEMVGSINPMLLAFLALPEAYSSTKNAIDHVLAATKAVKAAQKAPLNSALQVAQAAKENATAGHQTQQGVGVLDRVLIVPGVAKDITNFTHQQTDTNQQQLSAFETDSAYAWKHLIAQAQSDAKLFDQNKESHSKFEQQLNQIRVKLLSVTGTDISNTGTGARIQEGFDAATKSLQKQAESVRQLQTVKKSDPLAQFKGVSSASIEGDLAGYDAYTKVFGQDSSDTIKKATYAYAELARRVMHHPDNSADLTKLATAQQGLYDAVAKSVNDEIQKASTASTTSGSLGAANDALSTINKYQQTVQTLITNLKKKYGANSSVVQAAEKSFGQLDQQLASLRASAIQAGLQAIQNQTDVRTSRIQGISPAAQQAQNESDLRGAQQQLAYARSHHADSNTISGLLKTVNDDEATVIKQRVSDARAFIQATGSVAQASISGSSPEAGIAQARAQLQTDARLLAYDKKTGAGGTQIAQDYAQVLTDQNTLAQDVATNAKAIADAWYDLQAAQTQDPVKQVEIQLKKAMSDLQQDIKNNAGQAQILQDQQTIAQLRQQQAQALVDIGDSKFDVRSASTQDPVKQAHIAVQKAIYDLEQAKKAGLGQKQINEDQAALKTAQQNYANAVTDRQQQTIEFNAATGKIDPETEASQLQKLVDRMKKLHEPLSKIQAVEEEIYNLYHGGGSDLSLNLGQIKVPTTYEVRRAMAGGRQRRAKATMKDALAQVQQDIRVTMNISRDADIKKVAKVFDKATATHVTAAAKAAGLI